MRHGGQNSSDLHPVREAGLGLGEVGPRFQNSVDDQFSGDFVSEVKLEADLGSIRKSFVAEQDHHGPEDVDVAADETDDGLRWDAAFAGIKSDLDGTAEVQFGTFSCLKIFFKFLLVNCFRQNYIQID